MMIRRAALLDGTCTDIRVGVRITGMADGLTTEPGET